MSDIPDRTRAEVQRDIAVAALERISCSGPGLWDFQDRREARAALDKIAEIGKGAPRLEERMKAWPAESLEIVLSFVFFIIGAACAVAIIALAIHLAP